mmetsp:Transcript_19569/g.37002  ORF Transcript_19569/g.37002 Transcript_19569/m.37002 type:complete len:219 (-) Transcript_19569:386-1042(-)|eukprot:scaffold8300_cov171-Amphora_coffeaeformis.AAC.7
MDILTQGMTLLLEGDLEDAVNQFLVAYAQHCESLNITQQEIDAGASPEDELAFTVESVSLEGVFDCYAEFTSVGNEFRIYDSAFIIEGDIPDTALGKLVTASVIRYNLGVIFHLLGIFPSNIQSLSKSFYMYSKVTETLRQYQLKSSHLEELEMALHCNLGHVHSHMLDEKGTNWCRQELQKRLEKMDSSNIPEDCYEFFRDTIEMRCAVRFDQAPAA